MWLSCCPLKTHRVQYRRTHRSGKDNSDWREEGEKCGVTAERDRVSLGEGEQNFGLHSRDEIDLGDLSI